MARPGYGADKKPPFGTLLICVVPFLRAMPQESSWLPCWRRGSEADGPPNVKRWMKIKKSGFAKMF
jgi:hypothetical protein